MSLDAAYNCQALTTAGIWDHQICLSILSAFLLTDGDEMYCHSLITMKATLEDELKKVRFMEHAAGTAHLNDKGLTYANICDLAETWYQEAKGVGKWPPATHAKDSKVLPSTFTQTEVHVVIQCFQKGQTTSKPCNKSNDTCNLCGEKQHWANKCPNKAHFTMKPCSDTAKPNRCSLGHSRCPGCGNSHWNHGHCQEGQGEQQANKQSWKNIPPMGMESTKTFHWWSKCLPPQWSTTHLTVMHTNYPTTSSPILFNLRSWLGLVGHNLFTLGSLGCCFEREKTGIHFSQIWRPINLLSFCHPIKTRELL